MGSLQGKIYWNDGTYDVFGYYPYVAPLTSVDDLPFCSCVGSDNGEEGNSLGRLRG